MVVLAVSSSLAIAAFILVSGQQRKTEFSQSVRDFEAKLSDIANDVTKGYFPTKSTYLKCEANGSGIYFGPTAVGDSASDDCLFGGKAVELRPGGNGERLDVYTVATRRFVRSEPERQVFSLSDLQNNDMMAACTDSCATRVLEDYNLKYNLDIVRKTHAGIDVAGIAFLSSLSRNDSSGIELTGAPNANLYYISNNGGGSFTDKLRRPSNYVAISNSNGVEICARQSGSGMYVLFSIGKDGRQLSITTEFDGCS